jgi:hypothetical protein
LAQQVLTEHAAVVVQVVDVINYRIKFLPLTIGIYTVAKAVCFERITSEAQWPPDVYFASVYGWAISHALLKKHDRWMANISLSKVGDGMGLIYTFIF